MCAVCALGNGSELGESIHGLSPKALSQQRPHKAMLERKGKAVLEEGMGIPTGSSFPLHLHLALLPQPQQHAAPALLGQCTAVITVALWGNRIFPCAVITAKGSKGEGAEGAQSCRRGAGTRRSAGWEQLLWLQPCSHRGMARSHFAQHLACCTWCSALQNTRCRENSSL